MENFGTGGGIRWARQHVGWGGGGGGGVRGTGHENFANCARAKNGNGQTFGGRQLSICTDKFPQEGHKNNIRAYAKNLQKSAEPK